jgi:hypothetical protein
MRNLQLFITILTLLVLVGCGDGKLATVKVTGKVTLDGEPLAGASITFTPKTTGVGHPGYATTDASGIYKLQTSQGAADAGTTPGDYLVAIRKVEVDPDAPPPEPGYSPKTRSVIPTRYAQPTTSELTATVENKRSNEFNFELTSQ